MSIVLDALEQVFIKKDIGLFKYVDCDSFNNGHTDYIFTMDGEERFFATVTVIDNEDDYRIYSREKNIYIVEGIDEIVPAMYKVLCDTYCRYVDDNKQLNALVEVFSKQVEYIREDS